MMTFARTFDWNLIRRIAIHPKVYHAAADDFSPPPYAWKPLDDCNIHYVLVRDGEELLGMFVFIPENTICWNMHVCLLPISWGKKSKEAGGQVIRWIFSHTACARITGSVPAHNRLALKFARDIGMTKYGINERSHKKNGILHDQILFGISRSEIN